METKNHEESVKERYSEAAKNIKSTPITNMCSCSSKNLTKEAAKKIGYTSKQLESVPEDANMGLGCGNPLAFSNIKKGDAVVDLGSGGGFDCFIASPLVGENGKVIGVDFTPEMVQKARANAKKGNYNNVEFIQANIDSIPLTDNTIDLIISNCVINLASNKQKVFDESYRILKSGGHLSISDIVLTRDLPVHIMEILRKHNEFICFTGTEKKETFLFMLAKSGFKNIKINKETHYPVELMLADPMIKKVFSELEYKPSANEISEVISSIISVSLYAEK